jgi:hypothetical protein
MNTTITIPRPTRPTLASWNGDTCDRCNAKIMVQALLLAGDRWLTLAFCEHHANECEVKLVESGADLFSRPVEV